LSIKIHLPEPVLAFWRCGDLCYSGFDKAQGRCYEGAVVEDTFKY
jgi:hypothetical protein